MQKRLHSIKKNKCVHHMTDKKDEKYEYISYLKNCVLYLFNVRRVK